MPKQSLRSRMLALRNALSADDCQAASIRAQRRLVALEPFQQAKQIGLYAPLRNEIGTSLLFQEAHAAGKQVFYPRICGELLSFHEVFDLEQLQRGRFGIHEPCPAEATVEAPRLDLIVVPGVVFDLQGHRIGFGKGYYDRFLAGLQPLPVLVGLCYDFQICPAVPAEGHDIRMHYLVTEVRVVRVAVTDRHNRSDDHISGGI